MAYIQYTFSSPKRSVTITMNDRQYQLYLARAKRYFFKLSPINKVLADIERATSATELENLAEKYDICDVCRVSGLHLGGVKTLLSSVVKMLYKYPKLRSNTCFIGSVQTFKKTLMTFDVGGEYDNGSWGSLTGKLVEKFKALWGDKKTTTAPTKTTSSSGEIAKILKDFNLQYILDENSAKKIALLNLEDTQDLLKETHNFIAVAVSAFGLFDALLIDQEDYGTFKYPFLVQSIKENEKMGNYPKKCGTPESVIYHEIGHLLDYMCDICNSAEFNRIYRRYSPYMIQSGLSGYATTSPREFLAEAFAEYESSNTPREIARQVGQLIQQKYNSYR